VDYFQALGAVDGGLAVRRLLNAHFGKVDVAATSPLTPVAEGGAEGGAEGAAEGGAEGGAEVGAVVGAEGAQPMAAEERVELTAAGERLVVRPQLPLAPDAVECADPEVARRVTGLLTRVQRASLPLS